MGGNSYNNFPYQSCWSREKTVTDTLHKQDQIYLFHSLSLEKLAVSSFHHSIDN